MGDYFTALSALTRKAFAHLGKDQERERLKELFVKGLRPNLKKIFWSQDPDSIESALLTAENREAYLKSKKKLGFAPECNLVGGGPSGGRGAAQNAGQSGGQNKNEQGLLLAQLADIQSKLDQYQLDVKKDMELKDQKIDELRKLVEGSKVPPRPSGPDYTCWGCGRNGHLRSHCPELKNERK